MVTTEIASTLLPYDETVLGCGALPTRMLTHEVLEQVGVDPDYVSHFVVEE